ncbi:MAG: aminotransferase class I/II-fold pyridoxal phosphate-dependent enzyme [Candidatus Brocadiae bacterium]|nr:aminotransferase class I/II-fold pyridoxal phosphate-dependent enzyme [Candidatus Brocadiia bacterium]
MQFQPVGYLEWMKDHFGRYTYDLANPAVQTLTPAELGLTPQDLEFNGRNYHGHPELLKTIAERFGVSTSNVVLTDGASMGIALLSFALLEPGMQVLLEAPNYEPLYRLPSSLGCDVRMMERPWEKGFQVDLESFQRRISRNTRVVWLTNLHNPSGVMTDGDRLRTLCQVSRDHGATLICSEVFRDLVFRGEPPPPAFKLDRSAVSIGSLSKLYGLDGLRVGWILCHEDLARRLASVRNHFSVMGSWLCEHVTLAAFRRLDRLLARSRSILTENLPVLKEFVEGRDDLEWVEPDGGTIAFLKLRGGVPSWDFARHLHDKYSTLVVPGDFFWAKGFLRVGFGGPTETLKSGLRILGNALTEWRRARHVTG